MYVSIGDLFFTGRWHKLVRDETIERRSETCPYSNLFVKLQIISIFIRGLSLKVCERY